MCLRRVLLGALILAHAWARAAPAIPESANGFAFRAWKERRSQGIHGPLGSWGVYATTVAESLRATGAMRESLRTTLDWDARPESVQTFAVRRARFAEREASGLRLALRLTLPSTAKFSSGFLKDALDVLGEVPETWPALASEKERSRSMASAVSFATRGRVSDFRRTQSPLAPAGDVPWGAAVTVLEGTLDVPSSSVASFDRAQPASKVARRRTWLTASGTIEAGENEVARWGELPW